MRKMIGVIAALAVTLTVISAAPAARALLGGKDIRDGSIQSRDIANRTVKTEDMSYQAVKALRGLRGPAGPEGPAGPQGASGGYPSVVASGQTVRGVVGIQAENPTLNGSFGDNASLPLPAASALADANVSVNIAGYLAQGGSTAPTTNDANPGCTGSPSNPTAPAGTVCIYVLHSNNATNLTGSGFGSPYGFKLSWTAPATGTTYVEAVWAYTAQ
jgi:hypothetical protein